MRRLIAILCCMLCCWVGFAQQHNQQQLEKLNQAFQYINNNYVDDLDLEPLVAEAIDSALKELDPHSSYLSQEEFATMYEGIKGEFSGIGINFITLRDTVIVTRILEGSPSQRAGLKKNDRILSVNDTSLVGIKRSKATELLRGAKGSIATLSILRNGEIITADVKRDDIQNSAIGAAFMLSNNTAYVHVKSFLSKKTTEEFCNAVKNLSANPNAIIVDLRGNVGGLLPSSIQFSELFLMRGDVIVAVESRKSTTSYQASKNGEYADIPVVVLIDEQTASASEIVAGALQDHDRATIIGRRSFGKGLVQKLVKFKDDSGMKLTIARYKTPSGRVIQRPYTNGEREEYTKDTERYSRRDTTNIPDSLIYTTLNLKRKVYGGGGISPDIYVEADTTSLRPYTRIVLSNNLVQEVIVDVFDRTPFDFFYELYPTLSIFSEAYMLDDESISLLNSLIEAIDTTALDDAEGMVESLEIIKAQIAEEVYAPGSYFELYGSKHDAALREAMLVLEPKNLVGN